MPFSNGTFSSTWIVSLRPAESFAVLVEVRNFVAVRSM